ncbi:signal peptide peptidase SppA [Sphingomonas sp.]|uniref:signal peptide peptidase SppA n=1 Tax=Sphingomonas sp. TaxID=28214 RepID=UPI003B3AFBE4
MGVMRGLWRLLVGVKDALVLLLLLLFFFLLYAALSVRPNPTLPASGALLLRLNGAIVEQPEDADPLALLSGNGPATREYRLRDVVRAIEVATSDTSIKAIVLDLDRFTGGGQAALATVGDALDKARRAGKPVLAYATGYADDGYLLAAHASEVWLDPLGAVLIQGPGGPRLYYKGLLDKLGVTANVYRVGTYKSAVEPYIRSDQSPEARAANQALADALLATWMDDVGRARPKAKLADYVRDPAGVLAAAGGDSGTAARNSGLVDVLGPRAAFEQRVAKLAGPASDGTYSAVSLPAYLAAKPAPAAGGVGVLTVAGTITDGTAGPGTAAGDTVAGLLTEELARKRIKALVVRVDSPGGSVTGGERIRSAILAAKAQGLPIVVSMGSVAASGGYWVSTPGRMIFAEPSTVTGSIGVFGVIPTFAGALQKLGLSADGVATTPLSGQPDVLRGTSPDFDRLVQTGVENIYARFVGLVAESRHLPRERVDEIGQGRVWAGGTARQIGLVDRFGGLDDAIAYAADQAHLVGGARNPRWIEREPNSWKAVLRDWTQTQERGDAPADAWTRIAQAPQDLLLRALADAEAVARGPAIQARCLECGPVATAGPASGMARALARRLGL